MTERTQQRIMLAGFRLLRKDAREGRFVILFRDRELFSEFGSDNWRVLASYALKEERDHSFETIVKNDVWTVEV